MSAKNWGSRPPSPLCQPLSAFPQPQITVESTMQIVKVNWLYKIELVVSVLYTLSSVPHVFWILSFLSWSTMLLSKPKDIKTWNIYMHYVTPPIKKIHFTPINTEDNFYEVQTTKCTKTLYKTDTIRPILQWVLNTAAKYYRVLSKLKMH